MDCVILRVVEVVLLSTNTETLNLVIGLSFEDHDLAWHVECFHPFFELIQMSFRDGRVSSVYKWLDIDHISVGSSYFATKLVIAKVTVVVGIKPVSFLWHSHWLPVVGNIIKCLASCWALIVKATEFLGSVCGAFQFESRICLHSCSVCVCSHFNFLCRKK